jgi:hypothetical protein
MPARECLSGYYQMSNGKIVGGALAGLGLLIIVLGIFMLFGGRSDGLLANPSDVLTKLPETAPEEQPKLILLLSKYPANDPRSKEADEVLRKIMKDSAISALGRSTAINALADKKDWRSLPDLAECLYDDKEFEVRKAAVSACRKIMGINIPYEPAEDPQDRKEWADQYKQAAKFFYKTMSAK